jgi:2-dehydropantoate 2-reductase
VPAIADASQLASAGTLIVAMKTLGTAAALAPLRHARFDAVLSLQNGAFKNDRLIETFGRESVLGALTDSSGEWRPDGSVLFTRNVLTAIGELDGAPSQRANTIAATLEAAGVRTTAVTDIVTREWSKFCGWIAQFPLAVLTRQITWKFLMDERSALVIVRIVREAAQLAAAMKVELLDMPPLPVPSITHASDADAIAIVREIGQKFHDHSPEHRMSAQQDVLRGSRLESEETLGYALRKARELGVPMPTLDTCYRILTVAHP